MRLQLQLLAGSDYQSDTTRFLHELRQENPDLVARQKSSHALLWHPRLPDAAESRVLQKGFEAARVPQSAYVYATEPAELEDWTS